MRREWIILLIILVIAGFFRLYNLDMTPPGLYPDEAVNANDAAEALATGEFKIFYPDNNGREGLYVNFMALIFQIFGPSIWAVRLTSAILGILTVFGLYLLAKELFNWQIGLISSYLISILFWHVNFSRIGFRGIFVPLLLIFTFYFLWLGFKNLKNRDFLISGVLLGLGMYTYIPFRLAPLLVIIMLLVFWSKIRKDYNLNKYEDLRNKYITGFAYILVASILVAGPLLLFAYQNPDIFLQRSNEVSVFASESPLKSLGNSLFRSLAMFNFVGDYNWRHNFSGEPQLFFTIGAFFIIGFVRAIMKCWGMKRDHGHFSTVHTLTLSWFFIMLAPAFLSIEGMPHALRAIGIIPVAVIFAAEGMWWIFERMRDWYAAGDINHKSKHLIHKLGKSRPAEATVLASIVMIIYLGITGWHQYDKYFNQWANRPEVASHFNAELLEVANEVDNLPIGVPKYVVINPNELLHHEVIMFSTQTYTEELREDKNVSYIFPDQAFGLERNAAVIRLDN